MRVSDSLIFHRESRNIVFKYQIPISFSNRISWMVSFYVLALSLLFTIQNFKSSTIIESYHGLQSDEASNTSYNLVMLPSSKYSNLMTTTFVDLPNIQSDRPITYSIEAEFFFNINKNEIGDILIVQSLTGGGLQNLMSTGFYPFDYILLQLHVFSDSYFDQHDGHSDVHADIRSENNNHQNSNINNNNKNNFNNNNNNLNNNLNNNNSNLNNNLNHNQNNNLNNFQNNHERQGNLNSNNNMNGLNGMNNGSFKIINPKIIHINGNPDFGQKTIEIRYILTFISVVCLICYLVSTCFVSRGNIHAEHIFSIIGLIVSILANFPLSVLPQFQGDLEAQCFNFLFKGLFSSFNLINLFLCVYKANNGQLVEFASIMSLVYIFGGALSEMTFDSRIVDRFFDVNTIVWLFFTSVALMSRISITLFIFYNFCVILKNHRNSQKRLYTPYLSIYFVSTVSWTVQHILFYKNGYKNYAFDFFESYIVQTLTALMFADIHWPQIASPRPPIDEILDNRKRHISTMESTGPDPEFTLLK
ncbi:hypothetical protein TRFO_29611 [Tritrichomonas foetus]|uniref:Uncharacterized protein n=1 Tax=Tritrichomonas foetus TaxID=1144522 RepID=A0A1J4JX67_9EUKA|nr:hypothetical protein TRFO_29611 [Tritrichomonas foetus]|eukprot:OHT03056.1 hypothetical protein TRFO_29611 [Tritrichomonas foetus]